MITIFTATYNRAHLLPKLYQSLLLQSVKDFEWVIVDDGSNDDTTSVVSNFINDKKLAIRYFKKTNGGKHTAFNEGVKNSNREYFFNVDSDDILPYDAIQKVYDTILIQKEQFPDLAGVAFRKAYMDGKLVGTFIPNSRLVANNISIRYEYQVMGDLAEIFKTSILKQYPFPENVERFCPEILVWNRIALKHDLLFTNDIVYHCEYIQGGLTANITKIRMNSPINTCATYKELFEVPNLPFKEKVKANINFWRFYYAANNDKKKHIQQPESILNLVGKLAGKWMHKRDYKLVYESIANN